jgi:hypothetical protein
MIDGRRDQYHSVAAPRDIISYLSVSLTFSVDYRRQIEYRDKVSRFERCSYL